MESMKKVYLVGFLVLAAMSAVLAQDDAFAHDGGEVVEGEFLINKQLEIVLPAAQRLFRKVPPEAVERQQLEPIEYNFLNYSPVLPDIPTRLRVLKLKDQKLMQQPSSFLTLGFGNYNTPLVRLGINSGRRKRSNIGLNVSHLSSLNGPVDKGNSGNSATTVGLFGKQVGREASLEGELGYGRYGYHFYGYEDGAEVDRDTIRQTFNDVQLGLRIRNTVVDAPLQYEIFGKIYHVSDKFEASEFGFDGGAALNYELNEVMLAGLKLEYVHGAYANPETINRSLVRIHPSIVYENDLLKVDVGFRLLFNNDTLNTDQNTSISPVVKFHYKVSDNLVAYANLEGDVEALTLRDIVTDNPFIAAEQPLSHTRKPLEVGIGAKGNAATFLAFDAGFRAVFYKNMYFYVNDPLQPSRFLMTYDLGTTSLYQLFGSVSYLRSKVWGSNLSMRFNSYEVSDLAKPWHKPTFQFDFALWYNLYDKVKLSTDAFILSGIQALSASDTGQSITLDAAVDINLKIDYRFSDRYSAFVIVNNLLNANYERFYRYPSRGLLAIAGFTVNF
jgi:hypothetical protein